MTAGFVGERDGTVILSATLENGTGAEGGQVELHVADSARRAYGLQACVIEFERFLNSGLRPEFRLDAALAMGHHGAFTIVASSEGRPRVIDPAMPEDLAA